ncbi:MAG: hydantoinase/oxoprolinase family protein, partial [Gaiellales bacterium]
ADLVLGRIDPAAVLGGEIHLDPVAAERAIACIAERLGVSVVEAAGGIVRIADAQMADLIRTATIERGHDPRAFTLVAFGGAGPLHVGRFAADVGVREAIVPRSAGVFSALGLATADYRRTYRRSRRMRLPLDPGTVAPFVDELREQAEADFAAARIEGGLTLTPWVDVRYRRQTHQLRVPATWQGGVTMDVEPVQRAFEALYDRTFGTGTGYAAAGIESTAIGLHAVASGAGPVATLERSWSDGPDWRPGASSTLMGAAGPAARHRPVWFDGWVDATPVHAAADLGPDATIHGPAIGDWGVTSLVVHRGQNATVDEAGNLRLRFGVAAASA